MGVATYNLMIDRMFFFIQTVSENCVFSFFNVEVECSVEDERRKQPVSLLPMLSGGCTL